MIGALNRKRLPASRSSSIKQIAPVLLKTDGRVVLMHDMVVPSSFIMPTPFSPCSVLQSLSYLLPFGPLLANEYKRLDKDWVLIGKHAGTLEQNGIRNNDRRNRS